MKTTCEVEIFDAAHDRLCKRDDTLAVCSSERHEMLETFARFEAPGTFAASQIAELLRNYDQ